MAFARASFLLLLLCLAAPLGAQDGAARPSSIHGRVLSSAGSPVAGAAVTVRPERDTAEVARAETGADGRFRVRVAPGRYVVRVRHEGAQAVSGALTVSAGAGAAADAGDLRLSGGVALDWIQARAQRPPVTHAEDRTIYSVRDMPSVTGGAADVLRTVPELEVDLDGTVTMAGNRPVTIHINGRPSPLRGEALTEFIRNLPADRIERIEVIPNPSVRYEGGNTAIVNVVLRKDVRLGLSGSLSASAATRGGNSLSGQLAYQGGRLTLFGGSSGNLFRYGDRSFELREHLRAAPVTFLEQARRSDGSSSSGGGDLTAEVDVGAKETLWASGTFYGGASGNDAVSRNRLLDAGRAEMRVFERVSRGEGGYHFGEAAAGLRRILEAQRHELSLELRRGWNGYDSEGRAEESTSRRLAPPAPGEDELRVTDFGQDERSLTLKGDYLRPLGSGRLEIGMRSYLRSSAESSVLEVTGPPPDSHPREGSRFAYRARENEHAAYVNLGRKVGRVSLQGGLRAEAADVEISAGGDQVVALDYLSVFPSANVSLQVNDGGDVRLSYARRVRRPSIGALNPFVPRTDPLNVRLGNPGLRPTATTSLRIDATRRAGLLTLRLSPYYARTTDEVEYLRTVDSAGVATTVPMNVAAVTTLGATLNATLRPGAWGMLSATLGGSRTDRDARNLSAAYSGAATSRFVSVNASAEPGRGYGLQASLRLSSPFERPQGRYSSTLWSEVGVRRHLWREKASLNVRMTDPLGVHRTTFLSRDPSFRGTSRNSSSWSGRSASVSFTWRFGNTPNRRSTPSQPAQGGAAGGPPS